MRILHEKLHLQHHKHTGRLLHHKHTSYRGLAVVFVFAGLTMAGLNVLARAAADSFSVGGTVAAAVPTSTPVISNPPGGVVTAGTVQISGTCPLVSPQPIVIVTVNGKPAGSSICDSADNFSVPVTLAPGAQQLVASTQTITGGNGPATTPVQFTYNPKTVVAGTPELTTDNTFAYLGADETGAWSGTISGGKAPYYLHVDWGDGTQNNYKPAAGTQQYSHKYTKITPYNAAFYLADSTGASTTMQYAMASYSTAAPLGTTTASNNDAPLITPQIAGLYGLFVSAMAICGIVYLEAKHAHKHPVPIPGIG